MVGRRTKRKMNMIDKLIGYKEDDIDNMNQISEDTGFSFTEIQRKINGFFFSDVDNLEEVFGELEDEDDEEDTED